MGFLDTLKSVGSSALSAATGGLIDFGGSVLENSYIQSPNSEEAWHQSRQSASEAYDRSRIQALDAWNRSKKAATTQNVRANEASALQFKREKQAYKKRYRWTTKDMRKAGLNPILAATGGYSVGNGPNASLPSLAQANVYMGQTPSSSAQLARNPTGSFTRSGLAQSQTQETKQKTKLTSQKVKESIQNVLNMRAQRKLTTQQEIESVKRVFNLEQQFSKMAREMSLLVDKSDLTQEQTTNAQEMRKQIQAITYQITEQTKRLEKTANVYEGPIGQLLTYLQEIMRSLGIPVVQAVLRKGSSK